MKTRIIVTGLTETNLPFEQTECHDGYVSSADIDAAVLKAINRGLCSNKPYEARLEKIEDTVTEELIKSKIKKVTYTVLPSQVSLICELTLENGFTVRGEASCVDPSRFNEEIGKEIAYEDAFDKCWQLEGYLLKERLYREAINDTK